VVVGVWCLYIVGVGADFMEFRFMVPILPLLAIAASYLIDRFTRVGTEVALVVVLGLFSFSHTQVRNWAFPVFTFQDLSHWPAHYTGSWHSMGLILRDAFPGGIERPGQPLIAVVPLGVIPYYSELPAVDMLGLADETVAREGLTGPVYYPGHVRMAPLHYLVERKTNLIVGQPLIDDLEPGRTRYRTGELIPVYPVVDLKQLPDSAQVIQIPLSKDEVWPIIYLHQNDRVDAAIRREGWKVFPIVEGCRPGDVDFAAKLVGQDTCPDD
jgi:arabinofuranosyltransferase